jgi:hypothetical protein
VSILNYADDIRLALHVLDVIHKADAQLHGALKGQEVDIQTPADLPRIRTKSGRHFRIPFIPLVADDDPKPHAGHPAGGGSP